MPEVSTLPPRTALVSAGADGLGRVIARALLAEGAQVHVFDRSAEAVAAFLAENPGASATVADISSPTDVELVFADLKARYGRLDLLVNNAGIAGPVGLVEDNDVGEWDRCISVNLSGMFYVTRLAVPLLKAAGTGACMVNISSTAGLFGCPLRSAYVATKWAIIGLTKTWAMELGPHGIRVNAICPGSINGPRIERVIAADAAERGVDPEVVRQMYYQQVSMRGFVEAEDVASMVVYLASPAGRMICGQALGIDGHTEGFSAN